MATWGLQLPSVASSVGLTDARNTGFGATQGVFREYYFRHPPFEGNQLVASIGLLVVVSIMQYAALLPYRV
jgi:hypothetical protein